MAAIELGALAGLVLEIDFGDVVAAKKRYGSPLRQGERVGEVGAGRRDVAVDAGHEFLGKDAGARGAAALHQLRHLHFRFELRPPFGVGDAEGQVIGALAHARVEAELQGNAIDLLLAHPDVVDCVLLLTVDLGLDGIAVLIQYRLDVRIGVGRAFTVVIDVREFLLDQQLLAVDVTLLEDRAVTIESVGIDVPVERVARNAPAIRQPGGTLKNELYQRVLSSVGMCEHLRPVDLEQLDRRGAVADQVGLGKPYAQVETGVGSLVTECSEEAQCIRVREVAPAGLLEVIHVAVVAPGAIVAACLRRSPQPFPRSAVHLGLRPVVFEAILHVQRQRPAERIEAEHGVRTRHQLHGVHRRERNEVPVDGVAKGLVDAHAVLIDGEAGRQAEQGRSGKPAEVDVRLQRIVLRVTDADAAKITIQEISEIERLRPLYVLRSRTLHIGGYALQRYIRVIRRDDDDLAENLVPASLSALLLLVVVVVLIVSVILIIPIFLLIVDRGENDERMSDDHEQAQRQGRPNGVSSSVHRASPGSNLVVVDAQALPDGQAHGNNSRITHERERWTGRSSKRHRDFFPVACSFHAPKEEAAMLNSAPVRDPEQKTDHLSPRHDAVVVVCVTLFVAGFSVYIELNEALFAMTRRWEVLQLDELPVTLLALTVCLAWFAWRRFRDARGQLDRRRVAEARLEVLLLENRRLARDYLQLQESERKLLAHELHDELGQYLNAIKIDAVAIQQRSSDQASPLLRASAIIEHADHVHAVVRDLIGKLRPVGLDELGLRAALEHSLDSWRRRLPDMHFDVLLEGNLDGVSEPLALTLYRLLQEGLTNVSRHARAARVEVRLLRSMSSSGDEVMLSLVDDGCGAEPGKRGAGLGLIGMRERVEMLGGQFHVATGPAQGFSISARIPTTQILQGATS